MLSFLQNLFITYFSLNIVRYIFSQNYKNDKQTNDVSLSGRLWVHKTALKKLLINIVDRDHLAPYMWRIFLTWANEANVSDKILPIVVKRNKINLWLFLVNGSLVPSQSFPYVIRWSVGEIGESHTGYSLFWEKKVIQLAEPSC